MREFNTMVLEDGIEYTEVDNLIYNDFKYVLLSNINNVKESCIRKMSVEDNDNYVYRLENEKEFDMILSMFVEKNKALFG